MTPTERACQIDQQEFEAECVAMRQRAHAMLMRKPARDPRVDEWIKRGAEPAVTSFKPQTAPTNQTVSPNFRRPATMHEAFGREQSLDQWAQEFGIARATLRTRLRLGWALEAALRKPPGQTGRRVHLPRPGVPSDFTPSRETGG